MAAKQHYGRVGAAVWAWGNRGRGASVFRTVSKSVSSGKPITTWTVYLWRTGRPVYRQVDYRTKTEAMEYAGGLRRRYRAYAGV